MNVVTSELLSGAAKTVMTQMQDTQKAGSRYDWEQKESCNIKLKSQRQEVQNSKNKL